MDVQVLPVFVDFVEEPFQFEGALRRTLLLVERIHRLADEHADAAVAAGKIALIIALEGAHAIGQDPQLIHTMARVGVRVASLAHVGRTFLADGSGLDDTTRGVQTTLVIYPREGHVITIAERSWTVRLTTSVFGSVFSSPF